MIIILPNLGVIKLQVIVSAKYVYKIFFHFFPRKIKFDTRVFMIVEAERFEYV